ncbi:V-type immunoglobulin domain-containing suppressor of T-cell activation [Triplophysa rosa]|uniref:Platelet receptor Gi24 n=1 Tax=Triplophysa rosa TaxID=992332 RepID=A0A9W7WNY9_TRIRA|nr:V-type immunoglobulin domain-containing suppressor of T-cell activation [Triplophysa rosa]KAI7805701.1 platelet receptor Gi24 precursor [Triplophysa rosa]
MDVFPPLWLCFHLFIAVQASGEHHSLSVSVPKRFYECPEGANVTLICTQSGLKVDPGDKLHYKWLFTSHTEEHCQRGHHPRGAGNTNRSLGVQYSTGEQIFSITLQNIKAKDQGRYCCLAFDVQVRNHKVQHDAHNYIYLTVMPAHNGSLKCNEWTHNPSDDSVAEGLAIAACFAFILCLPLILILVYKQRQTSEHSRRAHELVRMDSAQGHENAVFCGDSPEPKPRTVSQIMRQSSETGHHLLSDPGTPFSPNIQGDVFFCMPEFSPESPNLLQE